MNMLFMWYTKSIFKCWKWFNLSSHSSFCEFQLANIYTHMSQISWLWKEAYLRSCLIVTFLLSEMSVYFLLYFWLMEFLNFNYLYLTLSTYNTVQIAYHWHDLQERLSKRVQLSNGRPSCYSTVFFLYYKGLSLPFFFAFL